MTVNFDEPREVEAPTERVDVFTLHGVTYSAPKHPPANVALKYLDYVAEKGEQAAVPYLLEVMLGREAYDALMNHDELEDHQLAAVFTVCADLALGAIEDPKGV